MTVSILIVDDEPDVADLFRQRFRREARQGTYVLHFASSGEEALDKLEGFASIHGADFYGLPRNTGTLTLTKEPWDVPQHYPLGADELVPLRAGERIAWRIAAGKAAPR